MRAALLLLLTISCAALAAFAARDGLRPSRNVLEPAGSQPAQGAQAVGRQAAIGAWCGTEATEDRPPIVSGRAIHAVYAYPSDLPDRFAEVAARLQGDAELIDRWWRAQDTNRAPRFDLASYPCGAQLDISSLRLPEPASAYSTVAARFSAVREALRSAGFSSAAVVYLVYVDGPIERRYCGQGSGQPDTGPGFAMVYVQAGGGCGDLEFTAAHEIVHALGVALYSVGATHRCQGDEWHVCDSIQELMYSSPTGRKISGIFNATLDVNHDDYYAHNGSWYDMQDSPWLRRPTQARVSLTIRGSGRVTSVDPGLDCTVSCETDWDVGIPVTLQATPADGMRLVRWEGACAGDFACELPLTGPAAVTALFAPETYPLTLSVAGQGAITSTSLTKPCRAKCRVAATSYISVRLVAKPARGWRFRRWSGSCAHARLRCDLAMTGPAAARAVFVRR